MLTSLPLWKAWFPGGLSIVVGTSTTWWAQTKSCPRVVDTTRVVDIVLYTCYSGPTAMIQELMSSSIVPSRLSQSLSVLDGGVVRRRHRLVALFGGTSPTASIASPIVFRPIPGTLLCFLDTTSSISLIYANRLSYLASRTVV